MSATDTYIHPGQMSFLDGAMWQVVVYYTDRPKRTFFHLDMHHSVKQYAAIIADMRNDMRTVHDAVEIFDNTGRLFRDSDTDPLSTWPAVYEDTDQRIGGNDA